VHAGAGGVGQIARAFGAEVFPAVSPNKKELVEGFGARPIDYRSTSVEEYVRIYTGGEGFDIVYDSVGCTTLDASFNAVVKHTPNISVVTLTLQQAGSMPILNALVCALRAPSLNQCYVVQSICLNEYLDTLFLMSGADS
jgi:NADPH:quinone reductase-like Zn-dependent oxidoreductase